MPERADWTAARATRTLLLPSSKCALGRQVVEDAVDEMPPKAVESRLEIAAAPQRRQCLRQAAERSQGLSNPISQIAGILVSRKELQPVEAVEREAQPAEFAVDLHFAGGAAPEGEDAGGQDAAGQPGHNGVGLVLVEAGWHADREDLLHVAAAEIAPEIEMVNGFVEGHAAAQIQFAVPVRSRVAEPVVGVGAANRLDSAREAPVASNSRARRRADASAG